MPADQIHLVRHGEVFNPQGVLYGRLEGYGLSELGHRMAQAAADDLLARERPVSALVSSPLQRTRQSAEPIAAAFGLETSIDERLIEPENRFEGKRMTGRDSALRDVRNWAYLINPWEPSWGEPFRSIATRMLHAIEDAWSSVDGGDVVLVSHQLPIWMVHRRLAGKGLAHDPRRRRCALSSITTLERRPSTGSGGPSTGSGGPSTGSGSPSTGSGSPSTGSGSPSTGSGSPSTGSGTGHRFVEVGYVDPAAGLGAHATDVGAV